MFVIFYGPIAQLARAPALQAGGREFESLWVHNSSQGSSVVEQRTENPRVVSSILTSGTGKKYRGVAQLARAPGLGPGGRRFKSFHPDTDK